MMIKDTGPIIAIPGLVKKNMARRHQFDTPICTTFRVTKGEVFPKASRSDAPPGTEKTKRYDDASAVISCKNEVYRISSEKGFILS
jgi:hypothetical protein